MYLSTRLRRLLKQQGIISEAQLRARVEELLSLDFKPRDVAVIRAQLGLSGLRTVDGVPLPAEEAVARVLAEPILPEYCTTRQVAEYLGLNRRTVANWCLSGRLSAVKLGDDWRIARGAVEALLRAPKEAGHEVGHA